jgi:hypothetical protein
VADGDDLTIARVRSAEGASHGATVSGAAEKSQALAAKVIDRAAGASPVADEAPPVAPPEGERHSLATAAAVCSRLFNGWRPFGFVFAPPTDWAYDEDGYCVCCGNGCWKYHMPDCELRDALDEVERLRDRSDGSP